MPKLKRASSSSSVSQVKKWKRTQREDLVKRQQERHRDLHRHQQDSSDNFDPRVCQDFEERRRQRDAEANRNARCDPERRREEQRRNTTAHRRVRMEEPERRKEEQNCDTTAHRRVCMEEPERRREEQNRDITAHRIAREDPSRRMAEQQHNSLQHREARSDPNLTTERKSSR